MEITDMKYSQVKLNLSRWSRATVEYFKNIHLSEPLRYCLDTLIEKLPFVAAQIKSTEQKIKEVFSEKPICTTVKLLTTHPGVGPTIAAQFAAEIFNPKRFTDKTQLAKYVGLAPSVRQSGQTLRDGSILKTGRPQLRCMLIQGAWLWIRKDPLAYKTFCRLVHNTGHQNKAITAMARKLAIHLWKMACNNEPYNRAV
jgi:transposase